MLFNTSPTHNKPILTFVENVSPLYFEPQGLFTIPFWEKETRIDLEQKKILLAGNVLNQPIVARLLQSWNAQVDLASDGLNVIEKVYLNEYDLILIDLEMQLMDGWTTAKFLRQRLHLQIPIIALSNIVQQIDSQTLLIAGFNGYLHKPIYPQSLCQLIQNLKTNQLPSSNSSNKSTIHSIDLEFIKEISNNDLQFIKDILYIFEEQTTEIIQQVPLFQTTHQAKNLRALVHKYKSSANSVGNKKLYNLCNQMEKETLQNEPQWNEINQQCDSLLPECRKILTEIPNILLKLEAA